MTKKHVAPDAVDAAPAVSSAAPERLARNLTRSEMVCHCGCGFGSKRNDIDPDFPVLFQKIRDYANKRLGGGSERPEIRLVVSSGCRCPAHNRSKRVGGTEGSQHCFGKAADIYSHQVTAQTLGRLILQGYQQGLFPELGGLGIYSTWVHVDTHHKPGGKLRRW